MRFIYIGSLIGREHQCPTDGREVYAIVGAEDEHQGPPPESGGGLGAGHMVYSHPPRLVYKPACHKSTRP